MRLFNVGIDRLSPSKLEANVDSIRQLTAELYCERMEFSLQPPLPPPPNA